jgi:GNAT superfamily N-acetyltransferase
MDELVWMANPDLSGFMQAHLPMGCGIRTYHAGDEWHWLYILRKANPQRSFKNAAFQQAFSSHAAQLPQRLYFLVNARGKDVGTAAAWLDDIWEDAATGMLREVYLLPEAREIMADFIRAVLARMAQLGHARAYVRCGQEDVNLYASLGFRPLIREAKDKRKWEKLRDAMPWPDDPAAAVITEKQWRSPAGHMA